MGFPETKHAPIAIVRTVGGSVASTTDRKIATAARVEFVVDDAAAGLAHLTSGYAKVSDGRIVWWEPEAGNPYTGEYTFLQDDITYAPGQSHTAYIFIHWEDRYTRWDATDHPYRFDDPDHGLINYGWGPDFIPVAVVQITVAATRDPSDGLYHATIDSVTDDRLPIP